MLELNDLLELEGLDPTRVAVLRHHRRELPGFFSWLAVEYPEDFKIYQAMPGRGENMIRNSDFIASFIKTGADQTILVKIYEVGEEKTITEAEYQAHPNTQHFVRLGHTLGKPKRQIFDLRETGFMAEYQERLQIGFHNPISWYRRASDNKFTVEAIHETSALVNRMPHWRDLILTHAELQTLPRDWKATLRHRRGVYYIFDTSSQRGYVGSAYGSDNILGRWENYASSGHGGNRLLKNCNPENLVFSILELVAEDTAAEDVIGLESSWKQRLHTRKNGLNSN